MYIWATIVLNIGPKVTMKPKNTLALLRSNALSKHGEKVQIFNRVINKYINAFSTIHGEWDESEILQ